jgi:hypothetical protein
MIFSSRIVIGNFLPLVLLLCIGNARYLDRRDIRF